jgi:hypothetical protein
MNFSLLTVLGTGFLIVFLILRRKVDIPHTVTYRWEQILPVVKPDNLFYVAFIVY